MRKALMTVFRCALVPGLFYLVAIAALGCGSGSGSDTTPVVDDNPTVQPPPPPVVMPPDTPLQKSVQIEMREIVDSCDDYNGATFHESIGWETQEVVCCEPHDGTATGKEYCEDTPGMPRVKPHIFASGFTTWFKSNPESEDFGILLENPNGDWQGHYTPGCTGNLWVRTFDMKEYLNASRQIGVDGEDWCALHVDQYGILTVRETDTVPAD